MSNLHTEFNNSAARSSYPFAPTCSRTDASGNTLPTWFIQDIGITIPGGADTPYIASAYIGTRIWSVSVAVDGVACLVASVSAATLGAAPGLAVPMTPLRPGASGSVLFGRPPDTDAVYTGRYEYGTAYADNARLLPSLVHTARATPVTALRVGSKLASTHKPNAVSGTVTLTGAGGLAVEADADNPDGLLLRLTENRDDYLSVCDKNSPGLRKAVPIRSINGVLPDASGVLTIRLVAQKEVV